MNVLSRLSLRNLRENKKRTISTIIGITLSVALICAVAGMGVSFQASLVENAISESGYWHVMVEGVTEEQVREIESNRDVKGYYPVTQCGYALLERSQNEYKPYVRLFSMDEETFEDLSFHLVKGRFAENENELVISDHIRYNGGVELYVGDKITLSVGDRIETDISQMSDEEFEAAREKDPYFYEEIQNQKERTFEIVGIIDRPDYSFEEYSEAGYTVISTNIEGSRKDLYMSLKEPRDYKESLPELLGAKDWQDLEESETLSYEFKLHHELLRWEAMGFSDSTVNMLYSVIGVVLFIILFTSVFCIRNSFAIATTEKIKMYSMLASVGTTKKQIRKNVFMEGMILGAIGIPLGIFSGFLAVFVLIKIVNRLLGDALFAYMDGLVFKLSWVPVLISVILGLLTILLSASSSAWKASRVSPIDGLRNANEIKIKGKKLKVPGFIEKVFKTGGVLAYKNLKRSRKKYRTTVISIAVSIFVFITMNVFIVNAFDVTDDYYFDYGYNVEVDCEEEQLSQVLAQENMDEYTVLYFAPESYITVWDLGKMHYEDETELESGMFFNEEVGEDEESRFCTLEIVAMEAEDFQEYAEGINLKYKEVKDKGILCDDVAFYNEEKEETEFKRRYIYEAGDTIEGTRQEEPYSVVVGAVASEKPVGLQHYYNTGGYLIVNKESYESLPNTYCRIFVESGNANQLEQDLTNLKNNSISVHNIEANYRQMKAMILVIKIFLYGFIAVISLIGVTNIFNTITSNMELRQKEFAMLKSVGMTKREFNRMVNLETIFYGTKAWIYGIIMGCLGTAALYLAFDVPIDGEMYLPINAVLISAVFVFVFVFVIMHYSIKKINKQNTIETIRKETV